MGTGPLGLAVIEELIKKDHPVIAVNRSTPKNLPSNIPFIQCDAFNSIQLKEALKEAKVVYHCIGLPYDEWSSNFPKIMKNLILLAQTY